jgi:hypothetical protein
MGGRAWTARRLESFNNFPDDATVHALPIHIYNPFLLAEPLKTREEREAVLSVSTLWAMVAAFSAGASSGFTGFGLAAVAVPLLLVVYEPKAVVALVAVLSLSVAAAVVRDSWRAP